MKQILVTGYVNPDLDAVGGTIAYCEFLNKTGRSAVVGILGEPHDEAKYILDKFKIEYPKRIENVDDFNEVILVDASDLVGLEGKVVPQKVVEIIDHRKINEAEKFPNAKVQIEFVGSACTLVAERFIQNNIDISKEAAILLCGAIISNTLNFKGGVTTDRDRVAYEYLNKIAQLPDTLSREMFEAKSDLSGIKLKERILGDLALFNIGNKKFSIAQLEIIGGKELVKERIGEILEILEDFKKEMELDFIFLNIIELEKCKNYFVTDDIETQKFLKRMLNIKFDNFVAQSDHIIMRKQIVPLLKKELEKIVNEKL